ncbi:MAG: hypothetical protein PHH77_00360 [Victivallaceae bacterium]|nr:hypothetical protein [Victivallaceae bacterium]
MRTAIRNCIFKYGLTALAGVIYGCHSGSPEHFEPPKRKQVEKQCIAAPGKTKVKQEPVSPLKTVPGAPGAKYRNISRVVLNHIDGSGFLTNINFVTRWNILGPFTYLPERLDDNRIKSVLHDELVAGEKKLTGSEPAAAPLKWELARFESSGNPGEINLREFFRDQRRYLIAYAVTYLHSDEALEHLTLYTGSSGYIKVWINHQLVHAYDQLKRQGKWDQDVIRNVRLKKGYNLIVVKSVALENKWNFYLRLADPANLPLQFIPVQEPAVSELK